MTMDFTFFSNSDVLSLASPLVESFDPSGIPIELSTDEKDFVPYQSSLAIAADPLVQAEVLNDISHLALDLATFFTGATASLRLLTVIGRILAISSDYLPDHTIVPEEFVFQMFMLAISSGALVKTALPMVRASIKPTSFRDRRTYKVLFADVGVSWLQFKMLLSTACDWIIADADTIVTSEKDDGDEEYIYWLYRGEVDVVSDGNTVQHVARKTGAPKFKDQHGVGMIGELRFARILEEHKRKASHVSVGNREDFPSSTIRAGPSGATLLRINTSKLVKLMENDDELADSIHCLLFAGIQDKLSALLAQTREDTGSIATTTPMHESTVGSKEHVRRFH